MSDTSVADAVPRTDPYTSQLLGETNAADPTTGDVTIQNYTINFGPAASRPRTACCGSSWSWTARSSSASTRMSACSIAAPRS